MIDTDVEKNIIYTGQGKDHPGLYRKGLFVQQQEVHWVRPDLVLEEGQTMEVMARIRYRQALDIDPDKAGTDLHSLQSYLVGEHGPLWEEVLGQDNIIRAVNQEVAEAGQVLRDGDEVAFFPPVTGG